MLYTINLKRTVTERKVVKVDSPNADIAAKKAIGRTPGDGWELDGPVRWLSPSIPGANLCATVGCPVSRIAVVFDAAPADFHFILAANRFPTAIRERARVELREIVKRTPPGEKWKTIDDARAKKARDSVLLTRFGSDDSGEKPVD